jgi:hypothetical protein
VLVLLRLLLEVDDFDLGGRWTGADLTIWRDARVLSLLNDRGLRAVCHLTEAALTRGMIVSLTLPGMDRAGGN